MSAMVKEVVYERKSDGIEWYYIYSVPFSVDVSEMREHEAQQYDPSPLIMRRDHYGKARL